MDDDVCRMEDSFCPARAGDERTYYAELDLDRTAELFSAPGHMFIHMLDEHRRSIFYADFPITRNS